MSVESSDPELTAVLLEMHALEPLSLPLLDALGCALSTDVTAPAGVPAFATVDHDGFALRSRDHHPGEVVRVIDEVPAGFRASESLIAGTCIRVNRGAPLPDGADTVVSMTDSRNVDGGVILQAAAVGSGVTNAGEVLAAGVLLARSGQVLDADLTGILARAGIRAVDVHPRPRVLVLSVGTEYVEPGVPTPVGLVSDHLSLLASALVTEAGGIAVRLPPVLDDLADVESVLDDNAHRSDLMVLCGMDPRDTSGIPDRLGLNAVRTDAGDEILCGRRASATIIGLADDPVLLRRTGRELLPALIGRLMGRIQT